MKRLISIGLILGLSLLLCPPTRAVTEMPLNVLSNGSACLGDATYTIFCTVGQPAIGIIGTNPETHASENGFWHPLWHYVTDVPNDSAEMPTQFELRAGFPNPMGHVSTIGFAAPKTSFVSIRLYDIAGREVRTLVDERVDPGYHQATLQSAGLATGIYFCRMKARGFSAIRKLILMK